MMLQKDVVAKFKKGSSFGESAKKSTVKETKKAPSVESADRSPSKS